MARRHRPKPPRRRRRRDPIERQAALETKVRYGPERSALRTLVDEANEDLRSGIKAEKGTAEGIIAAVDAAMPEVAKHYAENRSTVDNAQADVRQDLATLGAGADRFRAVQARETAAARSRLADALSSTRSELSQRKVDAKAGAAYAVTNRVQQHDKTIKELRARRRQLAGEEGAFKLATMNDLQKAQAEFEQAQARLDETVRHNQAQERGAAEARRLTRRGQSLTHRDRQRANQIAAGKGKGKSFSRESLSAHQKIVSGIQDAAGLANTIKHARKSQSQAVALLSAGKSKDNPFGGFGNFTARAAVSLAYNGYIKPHILSGLKSRGFLSHRAPKGWLPSRQRKTGKHISGSPGAGSIGF